MNSFHGLTGKPLMGGEESSVHVLYFHLQSFVSKALLYDNKIG